MNEISKIHRRREAAEYFDTHGLDETLHEDEKEVEVEVRKPLSAILSIRIDEDHLAKLKRLAKSEGIGITTMARKLLSEALDGHTNQPSHLGGFDLLSKAWGPPDEIHGPAYCVFSKDQFDSLWRTASAAAAGWFLNAVHDKSLTVTPERQELFELLSGELEATPIR